MPTKPKSEEELQRGVQRQLAAAQQLHDKKGPIYEKWLSRMQAAQEERRAKMKTQSGG